jgi:hypothetical protein
VQGGQGRPMFEKKIKGRHPLYQLLWVSTGRVDRSEMYKIAMKVESLVPN